MSIQGEFFERPSAILQTVQDDTSSEGEPISVLPLPEVPSEEAKVSHPQRHATTHSGSSQRSRLSMKDLSIPKLYYSISEVSRLTGIEPYVLRYWESEFHELKPQKNRAGNRTYSNRDIKFVLRIKDLLREKRYTIEGAKHIIHSERISETKEELSTGVSDTASLVTDPAQITFTPDSQPTPPQATISLEEIRAMKEALTALKNVLVRH